MLLAAATAAAAHVTPADTPRSAIPVAQQAIFKPRPRIEAVFVLDTTGSMSGLIDGAKRKIWSIADADRGGQPDARSASA